ncbi:MAG: hypothetical protein GEV08_00460 [Acidimicrobiia bacterium]|nr:hypothetical protein [Acidimicrobiia bacterium]
MAVTERQTSVAADERDQGQWWVLLVIGGLWLVFGWVVLSFEWRTVWSIALFAGFSMIANGLVYLATLSVIEGWKWLRAAVGVLFILTGIVAVAWPEATFLVLAAIIGWYLLFKGVFTVMVAIMSRGLTELWWLGLVAGLAEIGVGFWAAGYEGRSITLLVIWVGFGALFEGVANIFRAFDVRRGVTTLALS